MGVSRGLGGRAAAPTAADQGHLDQVAAGSVDSGNGYVGQSRNRG